MSTVTLNPISATRRRMPKEKLPEVMPVRFREGTFARIDSVAGENRRAAFIREAVEYALKRAARRSPSGVPIPTQPHLPTTGAGAKAGVKES